VHATVARYLNANKITMIEAGALDPLGALEGLDVSQNYITQLPPNLFAQQASASAIQCQC